ncbi:hypothetical protein [Streptococcus oralis]|uniref:hypothetical protein n=1 Tax=Streptococcus oralis TaxID=1303 RepID=UPI000AACF2AC|nr:hypothetical protein [Streptococcus oralis]
MKNEEKKSVGSLEGSSFKWCMGFLIVLCIPIGTLIVLWGLISKQWSFFDLVKNLFM